MRKIPYGKLEPWWLFRGRLNAMTRDEIGPHFLNTIDTKNIACLNLFFLILSWLIGE
jgi:hypothetical protein